MRGAAVMPSGCVGLAPGAALAEEPAEDATSMQVPVDGAVAFSYARAADVIRASRSICLQGGGSGDLVTVRRCTTSDHQRWLIVP